jgi:uncharacterized membrane protein
MSDRLGELLAGLKRPLLYVMGPLYVLAGTMHLIVPDLYTQIIPPIFPRPLALVYLSGVAEIGLGVGVLLTRTRRLAAWGLVALLVAIFPANLYMATHDVAITGGPGFVRDVSPTARWARLPFQAVFVFWAWWYTRPMPDRAE